MKVINFTSGRHKLLHEEKYLRGHETVVNEPANAPYTCVRILNKIFREIQCLLSWVIVKRQTFTAMI